MADEPAEPLVEGRAPRTLLPLRRDSSGHYWEIEVSPGRWSTYETSIVAIERIGAWIVSTRGPAMLVRGHASTKTYSWLASLATTEERKRRGVWDNWSCFTARPIPIHVDDDARGFTTASGGHVHRGIKIKNICEFPLGYAVVQDNQEAVAAGVRQIFAVDREGNALWEMEQSIGWCQAIYPWDDGTLILYSSGIVLEPATGKILDTITGIPEFFKS